MYIVIIENISVYENEIAKNWGIFEISIFSDYFLKILRIKFSTKCRNIIISFIVVLIVIQGKIVLYIENRTAVMQMSINDRNRNKLNLRD